MKNGLEYVCSWRIPAKIVIFGVSSAPKIVVLMFSALELDHFTPYAAYDMLARQVCNITVKLCYFSMTLSYLNIKTWATKE